MNRRSFFKGVIAGVATVAIELRVAQGLPTAVVSDRIRSSVVGSYRYWLNLDDPLDVAIYYKDDLTGERPIPIDTINEYAGYEYNNLYGPNDGFPASLEGTEHMELVAEINMSQGMAEFQQDDIALSYDGEMRDAMIPRMVIVAHDMTG